MHHLTDSTAKLCKGGKKRCVSSEDVPEDNIPGKVCEPVIVFAILNLPVGQ